MSKKKLLVVYYATPKNKNIYEADYEKFYIPLKNNPLWETAGITIENFFPPNTTILYNELKTAIDESEEIYLHFSGHGDIEGISFNDWVLTNDNFANIIDSPKVKFAFFSSCQSEDLLKSAKEKNIPVVIGTLGNVNIGNGYAITFQNEFYQLLAQGETFLEAFQSARTKLEEFKRIKTEGKIFRGALPAKQLGTLSNNKLQILFSDETAENNYLVFKTFVDRLPFLDEKKHHILVYSFDQTALDNFKQEFLNAEWDQLNNELIIPTEEGLKALAAQLQTFKSCLNSAQPIDPNNFFLKFSSLKILFLIPNTDKKIFDDPLIKKIFDDASILENCEEFKFGVAVVDGIPEGEIFDNSINFKNHNYELISFPNPAPSFNQLFKESAFDRYINEVEVDIEIRKGHIRTFPCDYRDKIYQLENSPCYIGTFFAPAANKKLIHFLINWLRAYLNFNTPLIICDNAVQKDLTIKEFLEKTVKDTYKKHGDYNNKTFKGFLNKFISDGHIIICKTQYPPDKISQLKEEITEVLDGFDNLHDEFAEPPDLPSFIFFLNEVAFDYSSNSNYKITVANIFPPHEVIDKVKFATWASPVKASGRALSKIIDGLLKLKFEELENRCPSHLIGIVCEKFKISKKDFLKIS